ncbi:hypothetical protein ACNI65_18150 [Roseateles sp. So40a]|uniref:hypothetical protein n=1 Tax=Roseateles sp. So40a TaxID=3400226 RepID=UPI003A8B2ED5
MQALAVSASKHVLGQFWDREMAVRSSTPRFGAQVFQENRREINLGTSLLAGCRRQQEVIFMTVNERRAESGKLQRPPVLFCADAHLNSLPIGVYLVGVH